MIQAKHCDLCKFPKRDLKSGLSCGLTNKKPTFNGFCSKIKFSNEFKSYLPELLNQIEILKKRKNYVYLNFILLTLIGVTIIFGSHGLLEKIFKMELSYSSYRAFGYTLIIYMIGAGIISKGFSSLINYKKQLKDLESEEKKINTILKNYKFEIDSLLKK
jgi:hypothetical protein